MKIAFVPVRGGSKGIHKKNVRNVCGVSLLQHSLYTLEKSRDIDLIVVATDDHDIREVAKAFGSSKIMIYDRDPENATDESSTESVMLEFFGKHVFHSDDKVFLIQVTNVWLREPHIAEAINYMDDGDYDSVVTVTRDHRFIWNQSGSIANYDPAMRPRRQGWKGICIENGAMYVCTIGGLMEHGCRIYGRIAPLQMAGKHTQIEIDEMDDLCVVETLLRRIDGPRLTEVVKRSRPVYTD